MSIVRPFCMVSVELYACPAWVSLYFLSLPYLISLRSYLCLQNFALIPAEVLYSLISAHTSHGFENCPCGPLFLLFIYDIVDFIRGAQIQSAGLPRWQHFVMMLINICGSVVWNLLCHFSGI